MSAPLSIPLPPEMDPYRDDLSYFFSSMVRKLHVNRHKGTSKELSIDKLLEGLQGEIAELEVSIAKEGQFEAPLEAADVANFAFLIASTVWQMTRADWETLQGRQKCLVCGTKHPKEYRCPRCSKIKPE